MKKRKSINWKVRFSNPVFWAQIIVSIFVPVLAYMGISAEEITTWGKVGEVLQEAVSNPYVFVLVIVSAYNSINDPTVYGFKDSDRALNYDKPNRDLE